MRNKVIFELCTFLTFQFLFFDILFPWIVGYNPILATVLQLVTVTVMAAKVYTDIKHLKDKHPPK